MKLLPALVAATAAKVRLSENVSCVLKPWALEESSGDDSSEIRVNLAAYLKQSLRVVHPGL